MTTLSIEDLLFAARRRGLRLPTFASSQLLCAAIRAAESQGLSVDPAIFLLDSQDGLVLDLSGAAAGKAPVQSAAELGRALLLSPQGDLHGPAAAAVLRALERGGFATLGAFRQALEAALPEVPAAQLRKVVEAFRDLAEAWLAGADGAAIFDTLETLCGAGAASPPPRAAPAPQPRPASAPPPPQPRATPAPLASRPRPAPTPAPQQPRASPSAPPPYRPAQASSAATAVATAPIALPPVEQPPAASPPAAASSQDEAPLENRLAAIEGTLGRLETRPSRYNFLGSAAIAVFSALAGAAAAVAALHATAPPPPPAPAPALAQAPAAEPVRACPPLLIIHEPAPPPAPPPPETQAAASAATPQPAAAPSAATDQPTPSHALRKRRSARSDGAPSRGGGSAEVSKGDRALRTGQLDEALAAFQSALAKDARSALAVRGLAMVHLTQGREADARREYLQYLDLAPKAPDASRIRKVIENIGVQQ